MLFLSYLFLGGIVWALVLVALRPAHLRLGVYNTLALLLITLGLVLFTFLSWWANIMPLKFGDGTLFSYSISFPDWYVARGAPGLAIVAVGIAGILSPALAGWLARRQAQKRAAA